MVHISLIAAIGKNRVIGKNNDLIWKGIPGDMKRFVQLTSGHPIIMGRKTFESIGSKALPNRTNIVITKNIDFTAPNCLVAPFLEEAIEKASAVNEKIFIIGGGEIYKQTIGIAKRLYLTVIDAEVDGDVFFPDYSEWKTLVEYDEFPPSEKFPHGYRFITIEK